MVDTQTILFGSDPTERIVAVEAGESEAVLYIRRDGKVIETHEPFVPWLLVSKIEDVPEGCEYTEFEGDGYRFLVKFPTWSAFIVARNLLRINRTDHHAYASAEKQFLLATGRTFFKGMMFDEVHRMQVDIETASLSYEAESGRILLIAVSDNQGFEDIIEGTEPEMLTNLAALIRERDPDVLEGHNIFGFDLPFIAARAARHGVALPIGRNGAEMTFGAERTCPIGGYSRPFTPAFIYGRQIVDTLLAVQRFDAPKGQLERHNLKEVAQAYGLAEPDRIIIPGDQITESWASDPAAVRVYALQDVRETMKLAALVCPSEFYLTQMVPDTYQSAATSGTGEKINSILIREYLRQGHAVSKPGAPRGVPGGYTELRRSGLIRHVVKCDVESLYPSLMLSKGIKPKSDLLDIFLPALSELTKRRIDAKNRSKTGFEAERPYWDGLQNSFKILINSFYGYLGASTFCFNDYDAAEVITTSGQQIVRQIAEAIEHRGGSVIEIDTDGVYFEAPEGISTEETETAFIDETGADLPEGIRLAHDGRYAAMLSLKIKNYVLVGYNGKKIFKGSSVRSRADELFGREYIAKAVDLLIADDKQGVSDLFHGLIEDIRNGRMPVEQFARRERVTGKTFKSTQKKRTAVVAKGVSVGEYITIYEKANGELGRIEDYDNDENRDHVLEKLYKFACRLREAFGDEFDNLFPKPNARLNAAQQAEAAGQQTMDFF